MGQVSIILLHIIWVSRLLFPVPFFGNFLFLLILCVPPFFSFALCAGFGKPHRDRPFFFAALLPERVDIRRVARSVSRSANARVSVSVSLSGMYVCKPSILISLFVKGF